MILLSAVLVGLCLGLLNAKLHRVPWHPPRLEHVWLVALGFLLQLFAIYLTPSQSRLPDWLASLLLIASLGILLAFCLLNRGEPGMLLLAAGLALNLLVIVSNGGFMPLPAETAHSLLPQAVFDQLEIGSRLGPGSKDILLPEEAIVFPWLADRFGSPSWFPRPFAFSVGDLLISLGVIWLVAFPRTPATSQ